MLLACSDPTSYLLTASIRYNFVGRVYTSARPRWLVSLSPFHPETGSIWTTATPTRPYMVISAGKFMFITCYCMPCCANVLQVTCIRGSHRGEGHRSKRAASAAKAAVACLFSALASLHCLLGYRRIGSIRTALPSSQHRFDTASDVLSDSEFSTVAED